MENPLQEEWGEELREELRQLRIKQYNVRNEAGFTKEDRERFLELQKLEDEALKASLARGELAERKSLEENLTELPPEKAKRLDKLQAKGGSKEGEAKEEEKKEKIAA